MKQENQTQTVSYGSTAEEQYRQFDLVFIKWEENMKHDDRFEGGTLSVWHVAYAAVLKETEVGHSPRCFLFAFLFQLW